LPFSLPKIYPITDRRLSGLSHEQQVRQLVDAGCRFVQLREKDAAAREFYADALKAVDYARSRDAVVIINDRADIALAVSAAGLHLGQHDMPARDARAVLGGGAVVGLSTHSLEQAIEAAKMPVNYIAIGPIFPTRTKADPDATVGLAALREVRRAIGTLSLVAIGGITLEHAPSVLEAGADSVAVISDLIGTSQTIGERFRAFINAVG
jgi:thiamine-phosphate pyrophosphorylase